MAFARYLGLHVPHDSTPPSMSHSVSDSVSHAERMNLIDFLVCVPRTETATTFSAIDRHGRRHTVTRAQLSAAIDALHIRQRQIIKLGTEQRWRRAEVCDYLQHISLKTYERDRLTALHHLYQFVLEAE